jgi:predicted nucleic acid-binding protein
MRKGPVSVWDSRPRAIGSRAKFAGSAENALELCLQLARQHGPNLGLRTLDSLDVACALELKADRFWTFDERQAKLVKGEGLKTS